MDVRVNVEIDHELLKAHGAEKRLAFGFANVFRTVDGDEVVDSHDEAISTEEAIAAIEDAVYGYVLESRSGDEQHVNFGIARLVETVVLTDEKRDAFVRHAFLSQSAGLDDDEQEQLVAALRLAAEMIIPDAWWVGFKIDDDDAWEKALDGTYSMFSIVGRGRRRPRAA